MKLKTKLSLTFALVVLLTVALISLLSNVFINIEFKKYIQKQHEQRTQEIVSSINAQYNYSTGFWDLEFVHTIGMYALYDGYIISVIDKQDRVLWDAVECNMNDCMQVMNDVTERMMTRYPRLNGEFTSEDFFLSQNNEVIGSVSISYFGPYFLSDNDFKFLDSLNRVLIIVGISSLILSMITGLLFAKRMSSPISKAAEAARQMAGGDYAARLNIQDNTKELMDLTNSINLLAKSLSYQEVLRKQLTADVAHELRTPITSVQTHLEAMIEGIWEISKEKLTGCHEEVMRIGTLVQDLERLAKADNDKVILNKKQVFLSHIISKAIDSFKMDITNKNLSVTLTGNAPEVLADEDRICQIVVNLLSNAVKYTHQDGHINITLSQTEKYAVFIIADDGNGIPEDELPFIFERFYRADKSRNRKTGGSGIGLAIVKANVEAHGGKVEVESSLGNGSSFKVMLPIS